MEKERSIEKLTHIMEAEKERLYRYAYYQIGDEKEAEDIIQELYLKLCTDNSLLMSIKNINSYIYRCVSNSCKQYFRCKDKASYIQVTENEALQVAYVEPESLEEEFALINSLLQSIPEEQSEIIRLRIHSDKSFIEISEILEIPPSTAKSRYKYGIDKLRNILKKQGLI